MKVCFLIPGFGDGGAQRQCIFLMNELQRRADIDVSLIRIHDNEVHDALLDSTNVAQHFLPSTSHYSLRNVVAAIRLVRQIRPDVLISWQQAADFIACAVRRCVPRVAWVMTERDSAYPREFRFWLRAQVARLADAIVSNSAAGDVYWRQRVSPERRFVIGNIPPRIPPSLIRRPVILHVGRLEPQKNVLVTAEAFALVAQRRGDVDFAFVGQGSLQAEAEKIGRDKGVPDRVRFLGFVTEAVPLIASSRAIVTMSHHEGTPNVMLEAIASGTPIVASDIPEHRAVLGPDYPFLVAVRHDRDAVAQAIELLLDADDPAQHLAFARERVATMTVSSVGDAYVEIFKTVIGRRL